MVFRILQKLKKGDRPPVKMTCLPLRKVLAMFQALDKRCMDFSKHFQELL